MGVTLEGDEDAGDNDAENHNTLFITDRVFYPPSLPYEESKTDKQYI